MSRQEDMQRRAGGEFRRHPFKRAVDVAVSAVFLCTVFWIVYVAVGVGIKCTSRGPVLFRQRRHGRDGMLFTCLKFRTMKENGEADTRPARRDDPRVTRMGRFLRRTYLDELPQFINVLRGEMSLVGPRPHMEYDTYRFRQEVEGYEGRLAVRPGITGLAQILGYRGEVRTHEDIEGRVRYDLWYIRHWSGRLDAWIFLHSLRAFLSMGKEGSEEEREARNQHRHQHQYNHKTQHS